MVIHNPRANIGSLDQNQFFVVGEFACNLFNIVRVGHLHHHNKFINIGVRIPYLAAIDVESLHRRRMGCLVVWIEGIDISEFGNE